MGYSWGWGGSVDHATKLVEERANVLGSRSGRTKVGLNRSDMWLYRPMLMRKVLSSLLAIDAISYCGATDWNMKDRQLDEEVKLLSSRSDAVMRDARHRYLQARCSIDDLA